MHSVLVLVVWILWSETDVLASGQCPIETVEAAISRFGGNPSLLPASSGAPQRNDEEIVKLLAALDRASQSLFEILEATGDQTAPSGGDEQETEAASHLWGPPAFSRVLPKYSVFPDKLEILCVQQHLLALFDSVPDARLRAKDHLQRAALAIGHAIFASRYSAQGTSLFPHAPERLIGKALVSYDRVFGGVHEIQSDRSSYKAYVLARTLGLDILSPVPDFEVFRRFLSLALAACAEFPTLGPQIGSVVGTYLCMARDFYPDRKREIAVLYDALIRFDGGNLGSSSHLYAGLLAASEDLGWEPFEASQATQEEPFSCTPAASAFAGWRPTGGGLEIPDREQARESLGKMSNALLLTALNVKTDINLASPFILFSELLDAFYQRGSPSQRLKDASLLGEEACLTLVRGLRIVRERGNAPQVESQLRWRAFQCSQSYVENLFADLQFPRAARFLRGLTTNYSEELFGPVYREIVALAAEASWMACDRTAAQRFLRQYPELTARLSNFRDAYRALGVSDDCNPGSNAVEDRP